MIAKIRGLYAPATRVLTLGEDIPPSTVLKRSHSNCGTHIVLPAAGACNRTWDHLNAQISEDTVWMAQEYVQSLDEIGEWRVLIVGGGIVAVMHTYKKSNGGWHGVTLEQMKDLEWAVARTPDIGRTY